MPRLAVDRASWSAVRSRIRRVPQYRDGTTITQECLPVTAIKPICIVARTYRLRRVASLLLAYEAASLPLFVGVILSSGAGSTNLVVPPIVEVHGDDHVLIDGLHRILLARQNGLGEVTVVTVRGNLPPLPGDSLSWGAVQTISYHTTRDSKFRNFRPNYFRPISHSIDAFGATDGRADGIMEG